MRDILKKIILYIKGNLTGVALSFLMLSIFFLWGTRGKFWLVFTGFWPSFHIIFAAAGLLFFVLYRYFIKEMSECFNVLEKRRYQIFPFIAFSIALLIKFFVFENYPHIIDGAHYDWTARLFLKGKLYLQAHPLYEFFEVMFMVRYEDKYWSLFLPGFSLFLALFKLLKIDFLLNPISLAVSIFYVGKIAEKLFSSRVSMLSMFFCTFSSFNLFMAGSDMSHSFNLMLTTVSVYLFITADRNLKKYFFSGLILSFLLLIRPHNTIYTYIPLAAYHIYKKGKFKELILFTIPFGMMGAVLMGYNYIFSHSPTIFPQDIYFSVREPVEFCHRPGFGKGCPNSQGEYLPEGGHSFLNGFWVSYSRLTLLLFNMTSHPYPFIFASIAFLWGWKKSVFVFSLFFVTFIGYFFFFIHGNFYGPRYLYEVSSFLMIPAAYGLVKATESANRFIKPVIASLPFATMIFFIFVIFPPLANYYSDCSGGTDDYIANFIKEKGIKNSVIILANNQSSVFLNLMDNPPYDKYGNIILKDLGLENFYAAAYFKKKENRDTYVVSYYIKSSMNKIPVIRTVPELHKIEKFEENHMFLQMEHKYKPISGLPAYTAVVKSDSYDKYFPIPEHIIDLYLEDSEDLYWGIYFKKLSKKSYYDFSHPILNRGLYSIKMNLLKSPCGSDFILSINKKDNYLLKSFSEKLEKDVVTMESFLEEGSNSFVIYPKKANTCIVIDSLEIKKKE